MTNKNTWVVLFLITSTLIASNSKAALVNDGTILLTIDPGVVICPLGGTYPNCSFDITSQTGSYWISPPSGAEEIYQGAGIILGTAQAYSGNPINISNPYDGSGHNITAPWLGDGISNGTGGFDFPPGTNWTESAITADNNGGLDMTGWRASHDIFESINLGAGGTGIFKCFDIFGVQKIAGTCEVGDSYTLDYFALLSENLPASMTSTASNEYRLHLEGQITSVPLPAAVWLFGSGLICLIGLDRRKV